jgi:glycosyltransferase involved in cell wall biosynthesis
MSKAPTISVLIPTLNAARVLDKCLKSIASQDYPKNKIEIIVADGGSVDKTLAIAKKYGAKIYKNPLRTGEAGKAIALKHAKNELVALIDSDNLLPDKKWFQKMVVPFSDPEIIGSEPWAYTYRRQDGFITRYCALLGVNDPLVYFIGNYDRRNFLSGKWTGLRVEQKDQGDWIKATLKPGALPTIGANGTLMRREILTRSGMVAKYLVDIDVLADLVNRRPVKFAKVKIGIIHLYCGSSILTFIRKQKRRVKDYLYYQEIGARAYPWLKKDKIGMLKFIFGCLTVLPLLTQSLKGYFRKPDWAWFFHPLACWLTLWVYSTQVVLSRFKKAEMSREKWSQ